MRLMEVRFVRRVFIPGREPTSMVVDGPDCELFLHTKTLAITCSGVTAYYPMHNVEYYIPETPVVVKPPPIPKKRRGRPKKSDK